MDQARRWRSRPGRLRRRDKPTCLRALGSEAHSVISLLTLACPAIFATLTFKALKTFLNVVITRLCEVKNHRSNPSQDKEATYK
jgi:hypothetical protein